MPAFATGAGASVYASLAMEEKRATEVRAVSARLMLAKQSCLASQITTLSSVCAYHAGTCPHSCSGHGVCRRIAELATDLTPAPFSYTNWEATLLSTCVCDAGWTSADCSLGM
jgi:hypothetical protein